MWYGGFLDEGARRERRLNNLFAVIGFVSPCDPPWLGIANGKTTCVYFPVPSRKMSSKYVSHCALATLTSMHEKWEMVMCTHRREQPFIKKAFTSLPLMHIARYYFIFCDDVDPMLVPFAKRFGLRRGVLSLDLVSIWGDYEPEIQSQHRILDAYHG